MLRSQATVKAAVVRVGALGLDVVNSYPTICMMEPHAHSISLIERSDNSDFQPPALQDRTNILSCRNPLPPFHKCVCCFSSSRIRLAELSVTALARSVGVTL